MTDGERLHALEGEIARLRAENAQLKAINARLEARLAELERRLGQDSHNSHKPPASDGLARRSQPSREPSARPNGGQIGHPGHRLEMVALPDVVVGHRPLTCTRCSAALAGQPERIGERRQVFDLPPLRMQVTEHQQVHVCCPQCHQNNTGVWPTQVTGRTQYGPHVQALAGYLRMYQLLPVERTSELLEVVSGQPIAEASILTWEHDLAAAVGPALEEVRDALRHAEVLHADETGGRIGAALRWLHVHATPQLTLLGWHARRGPDGIGSLGVLDHFAGIAVHDRWRSYWRFACQHALCHAHLQRDLQAVVEATGQTWAKDLQALFLAMHQATEGWRGTGGIRVDEQAALEARFWDLLAQGDEQCPHQKGTKQTPARNLLEALDAHSEEVLAFLHDLRVPFTNNQAERDLRMVKVQQKIAGGWRTEAGATVFCRLRSVIACLRKQGRDILATLGAFLLGQSPSLLPVAG
jgi:transposase